ncbi:hypothetical protein BJ742DRAFT_18910 [Cladochytrium replicatum]|nr:hypothetical protein BJ742DRAFT_18910 [Cladochytrium replicatum]
MHVHHVFPYIYIPYDGSTDETEVQLFSFQLASSLNYAITISNGKSYDNPTKNQHIAAIFLTQGIPFYGFHADYQLFLKIYFLSPYIVSKAVGLLESGAIMGRVYQTYESHVPFLLQFLIDYNLYGMDFIHMKDLRFRLDEEKTANNIHQSQCVDGVTLSDSYLWPAHCKISRQSYSELEIDAQSCDILNQTTVRQRETDALIDLTSSKVHTSKLVPSLAAIWEDEYQRRLLRELPEISTPPSQKIARDTYLPWSNEHTLRTLLDERLSNCDQSQYQQGSVNSPLKGVLTTYEAIGALYIARTLQLQVEASSLDLKSRSSWDIVRSNSGSQDGSNSALYEPLSKQSKLEAIGTLSQYEYDNVMEKISINVDENIIMGASQVGLSDTVDLLDWLQLEMDVNDTYTDENADDHVLDTGDDNITEWDNLFDDMEDEIIDEGANMPTDENGMLKNSSSRWDIQR